MITDTAMGLAESPLADILDAVIGRVVSASPSIAVAAFNSAI